MSAESPSDSLGISISSSSFNHKKAQEAQRRDRVERDGMVFPCFVLFVLLCG
jgi:hypothetical protein